MWTCNFLLAIVLIYAIQLVVAVAPSATKKPAVRCQLTVCYGCALNKLPQLRLTLDDYISAGYWENLQMKDVQYIDKATPIAVFYDEDKKEVNRFELGNWNYERFAHEFKEAGFPLRRPSLPAVKNDFYSEIDIGGTVYRYYGKGKYFFEDAAKFASHQKADGHPGRLLTLPCKALEDAITVWLKKENLNRYFLVTHKTPIWLGATDLKKEGRWKWNYGDVFWDEAHLSEGKPMPGHSHWEKYEPNNGGHSKRNEHCAQMVPGVGWNDVRCDAVSAHIIVEFGYIRSNTLCVPPKPVEEPKVEEANTIEQVQSVEL